MRYIVTLTALLAALFLYLLSQASANTSVSGSQYNILLGLNVALAVLLVGLISVQLWRLYRQMRQNVMGSRFSFRLLSAFALMAILPGLVVYTVSVNFLTRSIESWFNVKVEAALEGGLKLGQSTLDIMLNELKEKAEYMALGLAYQPANAHFSLLNDLREKNAVQDAAILTQQGRIVAFSSNDPTSFLPDLPSIPQLREARGHTFAVIEPILGKGLYLRVLMPLASAEIGGEHRILQLLQPVPVALSSTAESVQSVYQDYQELSYSRHSLRQVFALTLTLVLMLAMLSAVAIAFVLSRRLSAPLTVLAEGTRAIARGDYSIQLPAHGKDELGILVQSFNSMALQLNDATKAAERNRARVEAARGYLETILAHLSSGVIALDEQARIRTFNVAATQILGVDLGRFTQQALDRILVDAPEMAELVSHVMRYFLPDEKNAWGSGELKAQLEIVSQQGKQIILLRGTRLPEGADKGFVLVFDDMTAVVQAQRDAAWGEVARRLAHEIKNPLTPIQLSAERLQHKLSAKLEDTDAALLQRATDTIVNQVSAMKSMVNEFSEYARAPVLNLTALNLHALVQDVLALYESTDLRITLKLNASFSTVMGDVTMLRQVLHNLVKNAQEALENVKTPEIIIETVQQADKIQLSITDNGPGFPAELLSQVFEPYVTTKTHGTGLGLAIVKKMIEEHKGMVKIENLAQSGAKIIIVFPLALEMERTA